MDSWKDLSDIIQKLITSLGIIVGGIWAYFLFVRQRLGLPKLDIDLIVDEVLFSENSKLVHVELKLLNVGSVVLTSNFAELRLRQIVPIPNELRPSIKEGYDPVPEGETEIDWPMLVGREWKWDSGEFEIEPGEGDSLHSDFVIPIEIETAEFYCFLANSKKKRKGIGWPLTKIYNFKLKENKKMTDDNKKKRQINRKEIVTGQQKQQKQQKPQNQQQQQQQKTQLKKDSSK